MPRARAKPRLHLIYFALAAFDLLAVLLGLYLIDRITNIQVHSAQTNQVWGARMDNYVALMQLAGDVSAPGNDVFASRNVDRERARLLVGHETFEQRVEALRQELVEDVEPALRNPLLELFDAVDKSMDQMVGEAQQVMHQLDLGDPDRAGERMAAMDHKYVQLVGQLGKLGLLVREQQREEFDQQTAAALNWRRLEYMVAGLVVIMIFGITWYGLLLTKRLRESARATEEHLRLIDRMAALGTLSAGLGHDMGNLLMPAKARLEALSRRGVDPEMQQHVDGIGKSLDYLQNLSSSLRLLVIDPASSSLSEDEVGLAKWWEEVSLLMKNALPRKTILSADISDRLPRVRIQRHQLTQAVFNLVQNAGDALRGHRQGTVRVVAKESDQGACVELSVSDDGPGMRADVKQRCLEPFFSTKGKAISTGMGLALVHEIVQRSGGTLDVASEEGHGATFTMTLSACGTEVVERRGEARPRAFVSLQDTRMGAYIASVFQSLNFEVAMGEMGESDQSASVWVADAESATPSRLQELLEREGQCHVVLWGNGTTMKDERLIQLDSGTRPTEVRARLSELADRWRLMTA
ncbi:MAG: HAMP domain-containing histidine kinase [Phycisphaerales bacterium]|nr:HAMP domain-containing histidine kinase [Phycisphaerales bacterium]